MKTIQVIVQGGGEPIADFAKSVMKMDEWVNKGTHSVCDINLDCKCMSYWGTAKAVLYIKMLKDWSDEQIKGLIEDCFNGVDMREVHVTVNGIET